MLTEAQRLAFLKGREKRMANLEKKRLEKEEAALGAAEFELPAAPPKPKRVRTKKVVVVEPEAKPSPVEPESKSEPEAKPEVKSDPDPDPPTETKVEAKHDALDEEALADRIAHKLRDTFLPPPKVTRRHPRKTRTSTKIPDPPTNNFSWL